MQILSILLAVLIFGVIIFVHELGHYIAARIFRVTVREFSIGMGPELVTYKAKKSGIQYSLRLLPLGGYVAMDGENEASSDPNALNNKAAWKRFIILFAGAFMNLLLGLILSFVFVCNIKLPENTVGSFLSDYEVSSEDSGLRVGDTIQKIDGVSVSIPHHTVYEIMRRGYETVDVTVLRDGEALTFPVSFPTAQADGMLYGIPDFQFTAAEDGFFSRVSYSFHYGVLSVRMIWDSLFDLVTGRVPVSSLSGPVGITSEISNTAQSGDFLSLLYLAILICMNVGIFNLLPLPALDGGRLVFVLWEMITRKPVPQKYEAMVHAIGILLLLGLILLITLKDIVTLFG